MSELLKSYKFYHNIDIFNDKVQIFIPEVPIARVVIYDYVTCSSIAKLKDKVVFHFMNGDFTLPLEDENKNSILEIVNLMCEHIKKSNPTCEIWSLGTSNHTAVFGQKEKNNDK